MNTEKQKKPENNQHEKLPKEEGKPAPKPSEEIGGRKGPEPTRYGDWENNGKCVDF